MRFRKTNPPEYSGKNVPKSLEEWIRIMEIIFIIQDIPCDLWVDIATWFRTEKAAQWWNRMKDRIYGRRWWLFTFVIRGAFRTLREVFDDEKGLEEDSKSAGHIDSSQRSNI